MSKIHVRQLESLLKEMYDGLIVVNSKLTEAQQRDQFCTRSLAAYSVRMISNCSKEESAQAITDGYNDNGIDFIHINPETKKLILGQSKWTHSGEKSPEYGDILKFIKGVEALIECNFEEFNKDIQKLSSDIENIVTDSECEIIIVIVYSGKQPISEVVKKELEKMKSTYNDINDVLDYQILDLKKLHDSIPYTGQGKPIEMSIKIHHFGKIDDPYRAVYGKVNALEISQWYSKFGEYLFDKNLRKSLSDSNINEQVQKTLIESPENFWYFNNGITLICNEITQVIKRAKQRDLGEFLLKGINIVNGAQTVSNIFKAQEKGADISDAYVMTKIISLEDAEDETFSSNITKYTNSQNRINSKDFITLDPIHKRLLKDLQLYGKHYAYKTGDIITNPDAGFTFETAAIALACSNDNLRYSMLSKTSVGKLWDDITKPPYTLLFNSKTTALRVLRSIDVFKCVEQQLAQFSWYGTLSTHSNRFILHMVFQYMPVNKFDDPDLDFELHLKSISNNFKLIFESMKKTMDHLYPNAHVYHFFRNGGKCQALKDELLENLTDPFCIIKS